MDLRSWLLAYSAATLSLLIATANGKSGLSQRMEPVMARYLPKRSPEIIIRYAALLITGLFAAAYTIFGVKAPDARGIFASALTSTLAIELFPGITRERKSATKEQT
jgi:hypothetical protein